MKRRMNLRGYPTISNKVPLSFILKVTKGSGETITLKDELGSSISSSGKPMDENNSILFTWETPQFKEINMQLSNPSISMTPTLSPTSTIQMPDVKIRAQLQVTYEVGSLINNRVTIKVFLKNKGDATASNINLTIEHPHELEPIAISGSEKIGDTIAWKGELSPNEEHISEYSVKAIIGKDIEIPLKVTYAKITSEEKARALGVSPYAAEASINPQDLETILIIIKILKTISGFTAIAAIIILALVTIILRREKA